MVDDSTKGILTAVTDARVDATSFSARRRRRTVPVIDALSSRLATALERVAHVGLRAHAGEGSRTVFADRGCVAAVLLGTFVDVDALNKQTKKQNKYKQNTYCICESM